VKVVILWRCRKFRRFRNFVREWKENQKERFLQKIENAEKPEMEMLIRNV
jgi:hypothetical protein